MATDGASWIDLPGGSAIGAGQIGGATLEGVDLVMWRDSAGRPCVMEARCPHQWSDLASEGVVDEDELVCTAHFWRFDRHGFGTKLNVKGRRDAKARIRVIECRESDGGVQVRLSDLRR